MLVLPAELTHRQATACLGMLMHGLRAHRDPAVVVDARALTVFDSSALAVLLECRREALSENKKFEVQGLPPALAAMATLLISLTGCDNDRKEEKEKPRTEKKDYARVKALATQLRQLDESLARMKQEADAQQSRVAAVQADIAAARWRVEAAGKDVVNAKTQFYPNVNLVAFAGFSSIGLGRLLESGS